MNHKQFSGRFLPAGLQAIILFVLLIALIPAVSIGQQTEEPKKEFKYSNEDLLKFFDANQELSVLQRETQERINEVVVGSGLTMDRFNQIVKATQAGPLQEGQYPENELNAFNTAAPQVTEVQRNMQAMLSATLTEAGLTSDLYQEILKEFRSSPELQEHVRELLRERARQAAREARERERLQNPQ